MKYIKQIYNNDILLLYMITIKIEYMKNIRNQKCIDIGNS